jgi:hypothetical protein
MPNATYCHSKAIHFNEGSYNQCRICFGLIFSNIYWLLNFFYITISTPDITHGWAKREHCGNCVFAWSFYVYKTMDSLSIWKCIDFLKFQRKFHQICTKSPWASHFVIKPVLVAADWTVRQQWEVSISQSSLQCRHIKETNFHCWQST